MNNDNFLIESSELNDVKELCGCIKDSKKRNLAVANMLAAEISKKYFQEIKLDSVTTLHEIPAVLEDINIADIYIKNNYIDVKIYFENDLPSIPKSHFENNILPLAYMFIKVNDDLSSATVTGFAITSSIDAKKEQGEYIILTEEELVSYYDLENNLAYNDEIDIDESFEVDIFNYLDNKLEDKSTFFNILIASPEARTMLKNAAKTKLILSSISFNDIETNQNNLEDIIYEQENNESNTLNNEIVEEQSLIFEEENDDLRITTEPEELLEVDSDENSFLLGEEDEFSLEEKNSDLLQITDTNEEFSTSIENDDLLELEQEPVLDTFEQSAGLIQEENSNDNIEELLDNTIDLQNSIEENSNNSEEQIIGTELVEENYEQQVDLEDKPYDTDDFSTSTTPSLASLEEEIESQEGLLEEIATEETSVDEDNFVELLNIEEETQEVVQEVEQKDNFEENSDIQNENANEIDTLFNEDFSNAETEQDDHITNKSKTSGSPVKLIGILAILIALGYFGYTKFIEYNKTETYPSNTNVVNTNTTTNRTDSKPVEKQVAMPNETVENKKSIQQTNEATTETIPAIENNLDTSILVSNLSINWEVPAGYISSNTAKRYFTKIGKILQLNLKTELLLLSRQPITNKISIELQYNKSNKKFETKNILTSSGEKYIDDVILSTINKTLDIKLNMNMSVFENIVGNPVLVIHL